ncbi:hypothetical protein, partial [Pseudoalteromonas sp. Of11M-6]|uniref:hypothetical protein n=1 Tax=Pseudoalteromonas sp. Of11M-6 TaxID=2917754 RepID=UPI001EF63DF7
RYKDIAKHFYQIRSPYMTQSNLIAIDLAKNIFQVEQLKDNKLKFNSQSKKQVKKVKVKTKKQVGKTRRKIRENK